MDKKKRIKKGSDGSLDSTMTGVSGITGASGLTGWMTNTSMLSRTLRMVKKGFARTVVVLEENDEDEDNYMKVEID